MKNSNTQRTGWAKAEIPMNWSEEHPVPDGEWTECDPPQRKNGYSLNGNAPDLGRSLDDDKIAQAERDRDYVNSLIS